MKKLIFALEFGIIMTGIAGCYFEKNNTHGHTTPEMKKGITEIFNSSGFSDQNPNRKKLEYLLTK